MSTQPSGLAPTPHSRAQRGWQRVGRWLALAGRGATTTPFFAHHGGPEAWEGAPRR